MALFFDGFGPWRLVRNIAPTRELETFGPSLRVYDLLCGPFPGGSLMTSGGLVPVRKVKVVGAVFEISETVPLLLCPLSSPRR
ncbi:hypothetical protein PIB30_065408, partial [Stylosanthes scabra]|nr:hypothetical protein [Stylosanthes scabra]